MIEERNHPRGWRFLARVFRKGSPRHQSVESAITQGRGLSLSPCVTDASYLLSASHLLFIVAPFDLFDVLLRLGALDSHLDRVEHLPLLGVTLLTDLLVLLQPVLGERARADGTLGHVRVGWRRPWRLGWLKCVNVSCQGLSNRVSLDFGVLNSNHERNVQAIHISRPQHLFS